jgi:PKD repeat protein
MNIRHHRESSMQISGPSKVKVCLPLLIGMMLQAPPAASQAPVKPPPVKKAFNPAAAKLMQQSYVPPPPTQAVLTLTADNQTAAPNEPINFTLTWSRNVVRVSSYHFDWGDKSLGSDTTAPTATYRYAAPGVYAVRVTAIPALPAEIMMVQKPSKPRSIPSNAVTIDVVAPVQPTTTEGQPQPATVALTADRTGIKPGDPVKFRANLNPPSAAAQFHFDFGDSTTADTASYFVAHDYSLAGPHSATVTATDANGNQQATSPPVEVTVLEPALPPPVVQLIPLFEGPVVAGQPISVRVALNPGARNKGFEFDWGDGTLPQRVSNEGVFTHTYTTPGSMEVVVTALTDEAYLPPLQSSLPVQVDPKSWSPPSLGIVAAAGGGLIAIAVIVWLIVKPSPPRPKPDPPTTTPTTKAHIAQQQFRYEASGGSSLHKLKMASPSSNIGPLKLSSGMGSQEHRIKFPGRADT